jgi:alanine racemase
MDMLMVDLQNIKAKEGDEVIIFNGNPTLEEFSGYCQTIPYEVLTSISRRVKRIYIKD